MDLRFAVVQFAYALSNSIPRSLAMAILTTPPIDASDDDWNLYSYQSGEMLMPHLADFLTERFSYKPRYVKQKIWRTGVRGR
jgi:hypothetical protein